MNGIAGYVAAAVIAAMVGAVCLAASTFERHMADAQRHFGVREYADAADALEAADGYAPYVRWLPWVGRDAVNAIRTREAALWYWQGEYAQLLPEQGDAVSGSDPDNVDLQLVVANAAYRAAQARMTNQAAAMQALDEAMNGYLNVLKHPSWRADAAYNYEFVARLRDDIARGRRKPGEEAAQTNDALGVAGAPAVPAETEPFEIYIPLDDEERPETGEAGKAPPRPRRG